MSKQTLRILVADDDPTVGLLMKAALSREGYTVSTVSNGRDALTEFCAEPFAMVLLDVEMPELDGYQACSELRHLYGKALPIVLITCHHDQRASEAACKAGASDFISKPVNWTTLGERLRPLLAKN